MTPRLSKELILDIISRLPPRNAMQLCCMSKEWHSALSSPQFLSLHFDNFTRKTTAPSTYFWRHRFGVEMIEGFYVVRNDYPTRALLCSRQCTCRYAVVGVINGVVCMANNNIKSGKIFLWNPVIKRKVSILQNLNAPKQIHDRALGLAYDEERKASKLFRAFNQEEYPALGHALFQVFSMATKQWENLPGPMGFRYAIANSFPAPFFKGFCHWPVSGRRKNDVRTKPYILRVRACDCSFSKFPVPYVGVPMRVLRNTRVVLIEGLLGLIPVNDCSIIVWIMVEYGNSTTWVKRYTILGEVSTFPDEAILLINGLILQTITPTRRIEEVKVLNAGFFVQGYSESLELLTEGKPYTCFCRP